MKLKKSLTIAITIVISTVLMATTVFAATNTGTFKVGTKTASYGISGDMYSSTMEAYTSANGCTVTVHLTAYYVDKDTGRIQYVGNANAGSGFAATTVYPPANAACWYSGTSTHTANDGVSSGSATASIGW